MERIPEVLSSLDFDPQQRKKARTKPENLSSEQLAMLKEAFIKNGHPRLRKEFAPHQPYGRKTDYVEGVKKCGRRKWLS